MAALAASLLAVVCLGLVVMLQLMLSNIRLLPSVLHPLLCHQFECSPMVPRFVWPMLALVPSLGSCLHLSTAATRVQHYRFLASRWPLLLALPVVMPLLFRPPLHMLPLLPPVLVLLAAVAAVLLLGTSAAPHAWLLL